MANKSNMLLQRLSKEGLIHPPSWLPLNTHYLTIMGSVAYGCSSDTSDCDVYGFCIPKLEDLFPHLKGEIPDFGRQKQSFSQWEEHHVDDEKYKKQYDFTVFSIVRYFTLLMENNPNIVDSIFTPTNCVMHCTAVGNTVRENRRIFLHKGCFPKFKGYAFSQLHKMTIKNPEVGSKRYEDIQKHGYDVKFAYHIIRLLDEAEQILTLGDLDLQRNREQLKSVRRGEWTEQDIRDYFSDKEKQLEKIYAESKLPWGPDEEKIKTLLLQCLEHHFGSLDKAIVIPERYENALRQIAEICRQLNIN